MVVVKPFGLCPQRHMLGVKVKELTAERLMSTAPSEEQRN
jgi:hypothetical protein